MKFYNKTTVFWFYAYMYTYINKNTEFLIIYKF